MNKRKIRTINMKIPSKKMILNNSFINSNSKSNVSTTNFSSINPDRNIQTIGSYEDINGNRKILFNSPNNKLQISNYINNSYNIISNSIDCKTDLRMKNHKKYNNIAKQKSNYIYIRKNRPNMKFNNNNMYIKNRILLDEYRRRIMKLFLSSFKNYCSSFLRKHFLRFIRNITYLIMRKELFYKTNTKMVTKTIKINKPNCIQLSKSYDNFQIINQDTVGNNNKNLILSPLYNNVNDLQNLRYKTITRDINETTSVNKEYNQYSSKCSNTINTKGKVYDFKNIFISTNKRKNKCGNIIEKMKKFTCFIKTIKNIITKDKRIYIRINYIFQKPKKQRKLKNNSLIKLQKINELLEITQIFSFEYLSNKIDNLDESQRTKIFVEYFNDIFILKRKKFLLEILKLIKLIKCLEKLVKSIFFNKLVISIKENTFSNDAFLLDDKMDINIDNFKNSDYDNDV